MNRETARKLLGNNEVIMGMDSGQSGRFDKTRFREMAELAAESGATHVFVGLVPFRYGSWVLPDNSDPYAAWSNHQANFFRVCPPQAMQEWVSPDHAREVQAHIREKLDLIKPFGLKGTTYAVEPHWLPEGVYRAHPNWRGPQCELGRIARRPYFAPNIDDPEVLALYTQAVKEFVTLFPEIDQAHFLMNDSGSGLCWSPNIYPGMNGPTNSRTRDQGERIAKWLNAMQDGAIAAGHPMRMNASSCGLMTETCNGARRGLTHEKSFVRDMNRDGTHFGYGGASLGGGIWTASWPVPGVQDPAGFLAGLESLYTDRDTKGARASIDIGEQEAGFARMLIGIYLDNPGKGPLHRLQLVLKAAETFCGSKEDAEALVGAWDRVAKGMHCVGQVRQKGFCAVLPFAGVSMRWLIRPLVPQPEKLTDAEKEYYTRRLFSTGVDEAATNLGFVLGKAVFRGESVMWMARWCLVEALSHLNGARATVEGIAKKATDPEAKKRLNILAARLKAVACCVTNVKSCIMFQYALDIKDQPQYGPNQMDYDDNIIYDLRGVNLRKIAREELDNTAELLALAKAWPGQEVFQHARCPEEESVFVLGPDLAADFQRKMDIMLDHWHEYDDLYPATKVYDYDPLPKGNIMPPAAPEM